MQHKTIHAPCWLSRLSVPLNQLSRGRLVALQASHGHLRGLYDSALLHPRALQELQAYTYLEKAMYVSDLPPK